MPAHAAHEYQDPVAEPRGHHGYQSVDSHEVVLEYTGKTHAKLTEEDSRRRQLPASTLLAGAG